MQTEFRGLTALLVALAACGGEMSAPDFRTDYGSRIYLKAHEGWITGAEASELQSELLRDFRSEPGASWKGAEACLASAMYFIEDYPIPRCGSGHACFGYDEGQQLHVGATPANGNGEGPRASAFKHETIHWLQECVLGAKDPNHTRPEWSYQ